MVVACVFYGQTDPTAIESPTDQFCRGVAADGANECALPSDFSAARPRGRDTVYL